MAELKTKASGSSVAEFLGSVKNDGRRADAERVCAIMARVTGDEPRMWGPSMVGFGRYGYKYESGRAGEWFITGFSPRASALTLYVMAGFPRHQTLMDRLGTHKIGKSCLYIKWLADVDEAVLEELVRESVAYMRETYPAT
jgi:hypothetical protein